MLIIFLRFKISTNMCGTEKSCRELLLLRMAADLAGPYSRAAYRGFVFYDYTCKQRAAKIDNVNHFQER